MIDGIEAAKLTGSAQNANGRIPEAAPEPEHNWLFYLIAGLLIVFIVAAIVGGFLH